ncbi:hypothetical protein Tco_1211086 [Tanacetum coccineum]
MADTRTMDQLLPMHPPRGTMMQSLFLKLCKQFRTEAWLINLVPEQTVLLTCQNAVELTVEVTCGGAQYMQNYHPLIGKRYSDNISEMFTMPLQANYNQFVSCQSRFYFRVRDTPGNTVTNPKRLKGTNNLTWDKEKLTEEAANFKDPCLARTSMNEHCSMDECLALADVSVLSINPNAIFILGKLSLPDLTQLA